MTCDRSHFLGRCDECDARYVAHMSKDEVLNWYNQGVIGQDLYEAFDDVWLVSRGQSAYGLVTERSLVLVELIKAELSTV